ncbi:MAG: UDP-N-acetylmuramoyl-L-alanyl-D-glutamate--2,6-diaminopimelate ligase [Actinomycetota bacterium]|nr:UDP-N-acetylmuramoyl-L-alanyl-D-glutamate--2,6-diaminopimelate ligase [Actinomycetota bacterium]
MRLSEIAALVRPMQVRGLGPGEDATEVTDLAFDSRRTSPGSLFFCRPGAVDDGHRHAPAAVAAGAVALVVERVLDLPVPQLVVEDARGAMNRAAAPFFGHPSRSLALAGVTGTNGKTTTTYMLDAIFAAAGKATGLIGTVETRFAGGTTPGSRTTPESADLQRLLRRMVDVGVGFCTMEVTSVGLAQGRVDGTEFGVSVFTNLTQDHLDYHGDLETYYRAKRALFVPERTALAVVNVDDPYGVRLVNELRDVPSVTYALDAEAGVRALDVTTGPAGSSFRLEGSVAGRILDQPLHMRLPGHFNVANALAASAAATALGAPIGAITEGLANLPRIPGRFDLVEEGQDFAVVVDYAHTPDGLGRVLAAARDLTRDGGGRPRVIAVFGCGGDRDRTKRPLMGKAAAEHSDVVFVTSDNPRTEAPEAIMAEIESGIAGAPPRLGYHLIADREEAIAAAIAGARPGDVVVIAGKGHETTQSFGDRVVDFDDARVAAVSLQRLAGADGRR